MGLPCAGRRRRPCWPRPSFRDLPRVRRPDPAPLPYLQEALTIATFEPGIYEVVETFAATKR